MTWRPGCAAWMILRIAAKLIPFPLIVVWPAKGGFKFGWKREVMKGE